MSDNAVFSRFVLLRVCRLFRRQFLRDTGCDLDLSVALPQTRDSIRGQPPHADDDGFRPQFGMDPGQGRVGVFGLESNDFQSLQGLPGIQGLFYEVGNDGGILDLHPCRNFRIGQHREVAERIFKKAAERQPQLWRAQNDRLMAGGKHLLHKF